MGDVDKTWMWGEEECFKFPCWESLTWSHAVGVPMNLEQINNVDFLTHGSHHQTPIVFEVLEIIPLLSYLLQV